MRIVSMRVVLAISIAVAAVLGACSKGDPPSSATADTVQDLSPVRALDYYLDAFHVMKDDPSIHLEAHHYCRALSEGFDQCVLFDGNTKDAHIIGVEYIIPAELFESLPPEEKKSWHPHNYEILSGQLVMPGLSSAAEKEALRAKINSYGKTWHLWDTGHWGHPSGTKLPIGSPLLAWSYNRDGEAPAGLIEDRDKRMKIDTSEKRRERADLSVLAKPQMGVDDLRSKLPGDGAPPGVVGK
jgi:hypothetical protein